MSYYTSSWATNDNGGATKVWRYLDGPPRTTQAEAKQAYFATNHATSAALQAGAITRRVGRGQ